MKEHNGTLPKQGREVERGNKEKKKKEKTHKTERKTTEEINMG